jgi:acetyl-CoA acetyltransferase
MNDVVIAGVGRTACGVQPGGAIRLQAQAASSAIDDAGIDVGMIDALVSMPSRTLGNRSNISLLAGVLGIDARLQVSLESGGVTAISQVDYARSLIRSGRASRVLCVGGQDFLTGAPKEDIRAQMMNQGSFHPAEEMPYAPPISAMYAMAAQRWLHDQDGPDMSGLANIAAQIRCNGSTNQLAKHQSVVTTEDVLSSRVINTPLRLLECASLADGAAAFIVADGRSAPGIAISGIGFAAGANFVVETTWEQRETVKTAAIEAMTESGLPPEHIDVWELYDSFSITVALQLEGLGLCGPGDGGRLAAAAGLSCSGELPVCTHGGLLADGQPGIAGGAFSIVEAVLQLRGERGCGQVPGAHAALVAGATGMLAQYAVVILAV